MPSSRTGTRHFASRIMRLQFIVVGFLIVLVTAGTLYASYNQVFNRAEDRSLTIARSVAVMPSVVREVERYAAQDRLDVQALRTGPLQQLAEAIVARGEAYFVVVTEDRGLRLSHPNPAEIGRKVSTEPVALSGVEDLSREHGTLGESVRAKVPIYSSSGIVIGEVSVGVTTDSLTGALAQSFSWIVLFALLAAVLAVLAGRYTVRKLKRQTLGLEPSEIAQLVRDQQAVLYGVTEGVMGIGVDHRITVRNKAARQLLGLPHRTELKDVVGRHYASAGLDAALVRAIREHAKAPLRLNANGNSLIARVTDVNRDGVDLGQVVLIHDVTTVEALGTKLDAVQDMADALRAQRHEFANRMHAVLGLINLGKIEQAEQYLQEVMETGPKIAQVPGLEAVRDAYLSAFISAKAVRAHEQGIELRVSPQSMLFGQIASAHDAQDATAVLGNLLDNAFTAALRGVGDPWVEVDLLSEGTTLHLAVADSGPGIAAGLDIFAPAVSTGSAQGAEHGAGVGLPLIRRLAQSRSGDVWVADPGGAEGGAVLAARLPAVLAETQAPAENPRPEGPRP
ncbi:sensor histidine kinase [Glutamicibacter protophormiae]|uniref:histidine kinase n=1 Tax=Glutamicibacter protophormiae TaxID=37930 RepID=A0ABS4XPR5_GLUPR|nr:ATP-binding protein [Glutamicibacter protophormiae]MBP2398262.1 two-component system CitB family sensor kinase [Glutamicibacter protophormiae]